MWANQIGCSGGTLKPTLQRKHTRAARAASRRRTTPDNGEQCSRYIHVCCLGFQGRKGVSLMVGCMDLYVGEEALRTRASCAGAHVSSNQPQACFLFQPNNNLECGRAASSARVLDANNSSAVSGTEMRCKCYHGAALCTADGDGSCLLQILRTYFCTQRCMICPNENIFFK